MPYSRTFSNITAVLVVDVMGGSRIYTSGDIRVSSSSVSQSVPKPSLEGDPGWIWGTLVLARICRCWCNNVTSGRGRRTSFRGVTSAAGAGLRSVFGGRAASGLLGFSTSVEGGFEISSDSFFALASFLALFRRGGSVYIVLLPLGIPAGKAGRWRWWELPS